MAQNKALYSFGKALLFPVYKLLYRFKVKNKGAIPSEGGVILASNHLSNADPVLLGLASKRRLNYMAKSELFSNKFAARIITALGAFPVERGAGDGRAIETGEDILKQGNVMTIFIEGTRTKTGKLLPFHAGSFKIAQRGNAPVVVAAIQGSEKVGRNFPFRRTVVNLDILEVIPAEKVKAMSTQELSACCRNRIAGHLGEEVEE